MLPNINPGDVHDMKTSRGNSRPYNLHPSDSSYLFQGGSSVASGVKLAPRFTKSKQTENPKGNVKIHLSCSDAMRQTQYNKLIAAVNKFDTQRIRKAIREGKINNLIRTERNTNPALVRTLDQTKKSNALERPKHIDSPDNERVELARQRNKEYLTKGKLSTNLDTPVTLKNFGVTPTTNARLFDAKRRTLDIGNQDPLTPFELKAIKDQILAGQSTQMDSNPHPNQYFINIYKSYEQLKPTKNDKYNFLTRIQLDNSDSAKKLSPRLEEFCTTKKNQIAKILTDSELK